MGCNSSSETRKHHLFYNHQIQYCSGIKDVRACCAVVLIKKISQFRPICPIGCEKNYECNLSNRGHFNPDSSLHSKFFRVWLAICCKIQHLHVSIQQFKFISTMSFYFQQFNFSFNDVYLYLISSLTVDIFHSIRQYFIQLNSTHV